MAKKKPAQQTLGDISRGSPALDAMAEEYRELGDQRKALKLKMIRHMKKNIKQDVYNHDKVHVARTQGAEGLRVTIDSDPPTEG